MNIYKTMMALVLVFASVSAFANEELYELCGKMVEDKIATGSIEESERYKAFAVCTGESATQDSRSNQNISPRAKDTVAVIDAEYDARMRQMEMRNEMRRRQQLDRIEMQRQQQIMKARTKIEVAQIEASAPPICKEQVQIKERQENFDFGPALGDVIRGRMDRVPDKVAREVEDLFKNQQRDRKVKCDDTYYVQQMPEVYHERGVYTGKFKGILNNL